MPAVTPSPELLSLVQNLELNRSGWWDRALDRFMIAAFWLSPGKKALASLRADLIRHFNVTIDIARIQSQADRLCNDGTLIRLPAGEYSLADSARRDFENEVASSDLAQRRAQEAFRALVEPCLGEASAAAWEHFHEAFLVPLVKDLGATTYQLLLGGTPTLSEVRVGKYLESVPELKREEVRTAIQRFLDPSSATVRTYVLCLLNAYLVLEAVSLAPEHLASLTNALRSHPNFTILVDTNFLLSILGLHDNPSNEAALGLLALARTLGGTVQCRFSALPLTLEETRTVLAAHRDHLRGLRLTPAMAQAALYRASSGITVRFLEHVRDGGAPNSAEDYFAPYIDNLLTILRGNGADVFNASVDVYRTRQDVIDDINLQLLWARGHSRKKQTHKPRKDKSYESLLHDTVLWHFVSDQRPRLFESPLDAGYWVATLDYRLLGFDRFKQRHRHGSVPVCLHPTVLTQLLQFWMPRSPELERVVLGSIRMPLMFHAFDQEAERVTIEILRALSRYGAASQLPPASVTAVVLNETLRGRIRTSGSLEANIEMVESALAAELERSAAALKHAEAKERELRLELRTRDERLTELKGAVEATRTASQGEVDAAKGAIEQLRDQLGLRDASLERVREELEGLRATVTAFETARLEGLARRRWIVRSFCLVVGTAVLAAVLSLLPGLPIGHWSRFGAWWSVMLGIAAWIAVWLGSREPRLASWPVLTRLRASLKWLWAAVGATLIGVFHHLLGVLVAHWLGL
jgi:hypothetical protein